MEISEVSLDALWVKAATLVLEKGAVTAPRGVKTKELLGVQLVLTDPRARVPLLTHRKFSLSYAMGELAWYLSGSDSLKFMERYAPSYKRFSDDGKRLHGAYGPRIFAKNKLDDNCYYESVGDLRCDGVVDQRSQWEKCKEILQKDPDSRQAVIAIYGKNDCGVVTKDMPCTLSLQFLQRDGRLNMVVNMRSNDLWLGGLYDVFCFTALQELMANELEIPLGTYYHHVGSFHLYEKNWVDAQTVIDEFDWPVHHAPRIPNNHIALQSLLDAEERIWLEKPLEASENLCASLDRLTRGDLWELGCAAWRWKISSGSAEVREESRRVAAELLRGALGKTFERCFY